MSSFLRRIQIKPVKAWNAYLRRTKRADQVATKEQVIQFLPDGGYRTLHPTRGWRYVSLRRAALYGLT